MLAPPSTHHQPVTFTGHAASCCVVGLGTNKRANLCWQLLYNRGRANDCAPLLPCELADCQYWCYSACIGGRGGHSNPSNIAAQTMNPLLEALVLIGLTPLPRNVDDPGQCGFQAHTRSYQPSVQDCVPAAAKAKLPPQLALVRKAHAEWG